MNHAGVVVLGGTAGVGLEAACRFAEQGARGLCLLGRDAERGQRACAAVRARAASADVAFFAVDARDERQVAAAVASARERLGTIDALVTSTGPSKPPQLLHTIAADDIRPTLDGLILPPLLTMHAVLPVMRAQGHGSIVNIAPDAAKVATPGETVIGAATAHLGVAEAEDLAESILFLAGPAARRITGQALSVNGGISAA